MTIEDRAEKLIRENFDKMSDEFVEFMIRENIDVLEAFTASARFDRADTIDNFVESVVESEPETVARFLRKFDNWEKKLQILSDSAFGIYTWKAWAERVGVEKLVEYWNIDSADAHILVTQGPEDIEYYFDLINDIENTAYAVEGNVKWVLTQSENGDLFAVHEDFDTEFWV